MQLDTHDKRMTGDQRMSLSPYIAQIHRAFRRLEASELPIMAAVQGLCLAGESK